MKSARLSFIVLLILGIAVSCSEPAVVETFVRASDKDEQGCYSYQLDMSDSTGVFDIYLFTKVDCSPVQMAELSDIKLSMRFISPSERQFEEEFFIDKDAYSRHERFSVDYYLPYRLGLVPTEFGQWQLLVTVPQEEDIEGFNGLGLRISRR